MFWMIQVIFIMSCNGHDTLSTSKIQIKPFTIVGEKPLWKIISVLVSKRKETKILHDIFLKHVHNFFRNQKSHVKTEIWKCYVNFDCNAWVFSPKKLIQMIFFWNMCMTFFRNQKKSCKNRNMEMLSEFWLQCMGFFIRRKNPCKLHDRDFLEMN